MKSLLFAFFILSGLALIFSAQSTHKIKILIITGGHDFEREPFFEMFDSMNNIEFTSVEHPDANRIYGTSMLDQYDVLVYYDMNQEITEEQKQSFLDVVERGMGFVFLHHSLASYQDWPEYLAIQGGRYHLDPQDASKKSTFKHDVNMNVTIIEPGHPVTNGLSDFTILDEVYGNFEVLPTVQPLMKTDHPESGEIIGWAHEYGASKIVYLQLGHDHHAYTNPNYRQLVQQAIQWTATQSFE